MIIVEVRIRHGILLAALSGTPEATLHWEQTDLTGDGRETVLGWLEGESSEAFEEAAAADPSVSEFSRLASTGNRHLYQFWLSEEAGERSIYRGLVETGSVIKRATATTDGWEFDIAFPDQAALDEFRTFCDDSGLDYTVHRVFTEDTMLSEAPAGGLTDKQFELLRMATERGYFSVPRETNLGDLADALGISHQAASERLRRAQELVNQRTLGVRGEEGADVALSAGDDD
ncbi:helix-turn-helix domain-containing protein [Halomarina litorea]|uniref:helix-turn-helix domain-containing protein n=1 Tax=Halomarina litorea TaxID=2961595 RepID=UPI0020C53101|nr:helix-turn-helix domain-containing protein [Halomarina sp. BCD28]